MTNSDGWTIIQRREDESISFDRGWNDYVQGFGERRGNYWAGLEEIHDLTSTGGDTQLEIYIETFTGDPITLSYSSFSIGNAAVNYRLSISGYDWGSSTRITSNIFDRNNNMAFTTNDSDNDYSSSDNCAERHGGAWWFNRCGFMNLNGPYTGNVPVTTASLHVNYIDTSQGLASYTKPIRYTEMRIKNS